MLSVLLAALLCSTVVAAVDEEATCTSTATDKTLSKASSLLQHTGARKISAVKVASMGMTEEEKAQWLMMASFGPSRKSLEAMGAKSYADWIRDQMALDPTSHREYYRARVNSRAGIANMTSMPRSACEEGSRWVNYALTRKDEGTKISVAGGTITIDGKLRTSLHEPDFVENGLDGAKAAGWVGLSFTGYICEVDESIGGDVMLKTGSCSSKSATTLPNPALSIDDPALVTEANLTFKNGPKVGVILLAASNSPCELTEKDYVKHDGLYYQHDARMALVNNLVTDPAEGEFDKFYFQIDASNTHRCRPEGLDILNRWVECPLAAASFNMTYEGSVSSKELPYGCITDGSVVSFNTQGQAVGNAAYKLICKRPCPAVAKNFLNKAGCRVKHACGGYKSIVCGSPGEVASDPSKGHRYGFHLVDDHGLRIEDNKRDPVYARDSWGGGDKTVVWTMIVLQAEDQLRQRVAWALSQIFVLSDAGIGHTHLNELWLNYYDIFVRQAFGSFKDLVKEVTYNPVMAGYLTYYGNKCFDYEGKYPDENYAREIMQLFSIGQWKLNMDGSIQTTSDGEPILAYDNEDIMNFARVFTGFNYQADRGNIERVRSGQNNIDPIRIVPEWHDVYPKPDLYDNYIGDSYPLCRDLPPQAFLQKGATYEFLGFTYDGSDALTVEYGSELYQALQEVNITKELEKPVKCSGALCHLETVKVLKVGEAYYEYTPPTCVHLFFFNAKVVEKGGPRFGHAQYAYCADPSIAYATTACCSTENGVYKSGYAIDEYVPFSTASERCAKQDMEVCSNSGPSAAATGDDDGVIDVWTPKDCHGSVAVDDLGRVAAQVNAKSKENFFTPAWENGEFPVPDDCPDECHGFRVPAASVNVVAPWKIVDDYVELPKMGTEAASKAQLEIIVECESPSFVALQAFVFAPDYESDSYKVEFNGKSVDWHMNRKSRWFWSLTSPGFDVDAGSNSIILRGKDSGIRIKNFQLVRGAEACRLKESNTAVRDSCVCPMTVEDEAVFSSIPEPLEMMERLFIGAFKPEHSDSTEASGDVTAHLVSGSFDESTVFEYQGRFYKNLQSVVHVGDSYLFRNAPVFMNPLKPTEQAAHAEVAAFIDSLVEHPNVAPFIAYRLIQRFSTSNPTSSYIQAVAEAFTSGAYAGTVYSGKHGDLKAAVVATLLYSTQETNATNLMTRGSTVRKVGRMTRPTPAGQPEQRRATQLLTKQASGTECTNTQRNPLETSRSYSSTFKDAAPGTGRAQSMLYSLLSWRSKESKVGDWMQIDLEEALDVSGVVTQGSFRDSHWVKTFTVSVSLDGEQWTEIPGTFDGNTDMNTPVESLFPTVQRAKFVRIYPQSWQGRVNMRAALLVCAATCGEWDVRLTNVQGSKGTPEIFYQGAFRPLCAYKWYWGSTETKSFCLSLGASGFLNHERTRWFYDVDALEVRDWQRIYQDGLTDVCTAGNAVSIEIECKPDMTRTSTCAEQPTPAPTPVPDGVLQIEVQTAGNDFSGGGMSAFYLNGEELHGSNSYGFNVMTLSTMGEVLSRSTWDPNNRDDMKFFTDFISKLNYGTIILLSVRNRGYFYNPGSDFEKKFVKRVTEEALASLGADKFYGLNGQMPYAMIAKKGIKEAIHEIIGIKDDTRVLRLEASYSQEAPSAAPEVPPTGTDECRNWDVRLLDVIGTRGNPEIFMSGSWHPVCRHYFKDELAVEFCKKLGAESGQWIRMYGCYEKDALDFGKWGELYKEGLTERCKAGTTSSMWIECSGDTLPMQSSCAPTAPQVCSYQPITKDECPCEHGDHESCDLAECAEGISPGQLCEADQPLPDGREDWEVDNCAEHYDIFKYVCSAAVPTEAPTPAPYPEGGLHLKVMSSAYNAGSNGASEFYLNGASLGGPNEKGINMVVLSAVGEVLSTTSFNLNSWDKSIDTASTNAFVQAVTDIEPGSIVLVSVRENAYTGHKEADVTAALASLGAKNAVLYYRTPYVLIVRKGFADLGVYEERGSPRDYNVLSVQGWFSTTAAPTAAPTNPPPPTAAPTPAPTAPLTANQKAYGKLREPVLKIMHLLRAMEYQEADPNRDIVFDQLHDDIGQWMYRSPTVFNFYTPEFSPMSFNGSLVAPEFEIFTPPYAMGLFNGMVEMVKRGLSSCDAGIGYTSFGCSEKQGKFMYRKDAPAEEVLQELDLLLTGGRLGKNADAEIIKTAYTDAPEGSKLKAAQQAVIFTPEFNTLGKTLPLGTTRAPDAAEASAGTTTKAYKAVVKVFFAGGMDSFNMLVPMDCTLLDEYNIVRSDIALDANTLHQIKSDGQACEKFGIHPNLGVLKELYDAGDAAFISNIGGLVEPLTQEQWHMKKGRRCIGLFSHSNQQMGAQTLECQNSNAVSRGAGGRLGDSLASQEESYRTSSFSLAGAATWSQGFDTHIEILDPRAGSVRLKEYESMKSIIGNVTTVQHGQIYSEEFVTQLHSAIENSEELGGMLDTIKLSQSWDTSNWLARQLMQVARVIKAREMRKAERDLFFVSLGGFDHHNDVLELLAGQFNNINAAIKTFVAELKDMDAFDKVTLTTASDFGRTLTSNGAGSDHGWGGNAFMVGGAVKGGKIYNRFPDSLLEGNNQDAGRGRIIPRYPWESMELPVAEWMGLDATQVEYVYPNYQNFNSSHFIPRSDLFVD